MRKLSLTFPDEIVDQLSLFCLNHPKVCKKQSQLGWTSNDRIILVRDKYLEYYNLHPGFIENDSNSIKRKYFKGAIRLDFIHEVNFLPKNKIKKNYLELAFPEKKKIVRANDQSKIIENQEEVEPKDKVQEKLEKWVFEFEYDVKEYIEEKRDERKNEKRTLARIVPLSPKEIAKNILQNISPKSQKKEDFHEKNIEQYVQSIRKTKLFLKTKAELAEEEAARQKKKKEKEMAEVLSTKNQDMQQTFMISSFWREYFKLYETVIKKQNDKQKSQLQYTIQREVQFLSIIEFFNTNACRVIQNYVDEKVIGVEDQKKQFEGFQYYQGLWVKIGGKELNQQFMVNYYLNDIVYSLKDIKGNKIRLPLMSLFEYKGLKLLVMCDMPFSELEKTEVYNILSDGYDLQLMGKIKESLDILEDVLNVKSELLEIDSKKKVHAPLGASLKIFEYSGKKDKTQDLVTLPNFYYLINPGVVFPVDYNYQKKSINEMARLRPEIVAFFRDYYKQQDTQLLTQAFMKSSMPEQFKKHEDGKVIEASRLIESYWIPYLISKLQSIELIFIDSYSIKTIMQEMGINIRYLHYIYQLTNLPYVRQLVMVEALSRTIKKEFRQALSDINEDNYALRDKLDNMRSHKEKESFIKQQTIEGQKKYTFFALDFLNLVFGIGLETKQFWKIISYKCKDYFKISTSFPPQVKPGCLLNAVLWHCGLSINFDYKTPLFQSEHPFGEKDEVSFEINFKTIDFPSFEIQKLFRSCPSFEDKVNFDLLKQSTSRLVKMELLYNKQIGSKWETQIALCKMNNFSQYLQKPSFKRKMHPINLPYYIANKSESNFNKALQILNFSLPETHPLYVTFYIEYIDLFKNLRQPQSIQLMRKTAILQAVKSFGQFHLKTTQLYSKFYQLGDTQYYYQARRVKTIEACIQICKQMYLKDQKYQSCLNYCLQQIRALKQGTCPEKLGTGNYATYLQMFMMGLDSAIKTIELQKGIIISKEISQIISSFKYNNYQYTESLFRKTLIIHLLQSNKKYFLYKMVLFVVYIRADKERQEIQYDEDQMIMPCKGEVRKNILQGLSMEYYEHQNHSNWIAFIISTILKSFQYFNFLEDLFRRYDFHLKSYNSEEFKDCLGYLDILVRLYGQKLFRETLYDVKFN